MNKLFNGRGEVLIKSKSKRTILGRDYEVDDIIAHLHDVAVSLIYNEVVKTPTQGGELLAVKTKASPAAIIINEIKNNTVLDKLLYHPVDKAVTMTVSERFAAAEIDNGKVYLAPAKDGLSYLEVRSYDNKGNRISSTLNKDEMSVTFLDYEEADHIAVYITALMTAPSLSLETEPDEYVYLEVKMEGKRGRDHGEYLIIIPAAQVVSSPEYELGEGGLLYGAELQFAIINSPASMSFIKN